MSEDEALRVLIFPGRRHLVAQCLEFDVAVQGDDEEDVLYKLKRAIVGHALIAEKRGFVPLESVPPAPGSYWQSFDAADAGAERRVGFGLREWTPAPKALRVSELRIRRCERSPLLFSEAETP